ncbi:MAG: YidC/Oxa1 family membrane protein insertase [Acidaminobacteraceae bacterium]
MSYFSGVFGSLLGFIYGTVGSYGVAIILLTIIIKVLLLPLSISQIKQTKKMSLVQPKLKELQAKYKNDKEALNAKTLELYSEHKMNPLSGCLPLLIQFPILIGLFGTLREPITHVFNGDAAMATQALSQGFLWMSDLSVPDMLGNVIPSLSGIMATLPGILPIVAAITTYFQMASANSGQQNDQMKMMATMMPIMILVIGRTMSGGLVIYWTVSNVFQMFQQLLITKLIKEESK